MISTGRKGTGMERDLIDAIGALETAGRIWGQYGTGTHVDLQAIARDAAAADRGQE